MLGSALDPLLEPRAPQHSLVYSLSIHSDHLATNDIAGTVVSAGLGGP